MCLSAMKSITMFLLAVLFLSGMTVSSYTASAADPDLKPSPDVDPDIHIDPGPLDRAPGIKMTPPPNDVDPGIHIGTGRTDRDAGNEQSQKELQRPDEKEHE